MDPLEQGQQAPAEDPVVLRAAEPAAGPEFHELDAAVGAGQLGELADELADVGHDQALDDRVERQVGRRLRQGQARLPGTGQAEVELAPLARRPSRSGGPTPRSCTAGRS